MSQEIHIYGGRARRGSLTLVPLSEEARNLLGDKAVFTGFLKEFPEIKYSTEWGDWDKSNSAFIANKIANFAGAGDSIPGKLVRMLAGDHYHPPILTDKWTQLSASLTESGAYIELDLSLMAYPIINEDIHVEGLRRDNENLVEVVRESTSMFKWLQLGKKCMMPKEEFSLGIIKENIQGVWDEWTDKDSSGKYTLSDRGTRALNGIKDLGSGIWNLDPTKALHGAESAFQSVVGVNTDAIGIRIGSSFGVILRDPDNKSLLNSMADKVPLDFFISSLKFKFSPHVVRIMQNKKRVGCCPEYCEISLTLKSVCKVLPTQIINMCKY